MSLSPNRVLIPGPEPFPTPPQRRRPTFRLLWGIPLLLIAAAAGYGLYRNSNADRGRDGGGSTAEVQSVAVAVGQIHSAVRINGVIVAENSAIMRAPRIVGSRGDLNRGGGGGGGRNGGGGVGTAMGAGGGGGGGNITQAAGGGRVGGGGGDFNLSILHMAKGGTHVKAGAVVAEFDPESQAQRLDDYKDSVVQMENTIRKMLATLSANKEAHVQKVRVARAEWQKAMLDSRTAVIRSEIDAEKMRLTAEEAELRHKQLVAEQALVEESERAAIRASELTRDQAAIELERAENNVKRMTINSPIDGIVVIGSVVLNGELRQIREGDQVSAGQPFLYIVDPRSMILNAAANQVDADRMRLGMKARMRLDAYPDLEMGGTLVGIGAMSKTSSFRAGYVGEIPIRVKIDGSDARLLPDLTGSAEVLLRSESEALLAPRTAIFEENGKAFAFVRNGENWMRREIEPDCAASHTSPFVPACKRVKSSRWNDRSDAWSVP